MGHLAKMIKAAISSRTVRQKNLQAKSKQPKRACIPWQKSKRPRAIASREYTMLSRQCNYIAFGEKKTGERLMEGDSEDGKYECGIVVFSTNVKAKMPILRCT